ncbi:hypothetical protein [Stenotrophomonas sp.]|uniref:hypothetical protein n=1 Tax=Stenotrophomonas sp. TaxID=69392 RepID=UPI0028AF729A|nr:hypothetical protein [Stenotrophomonas sp.]
MKTPASSQAGQLDPQFGHGGLLKVEIPSGDFRARGVLDAAQAIHLLGVVSSEPSALTMLKLDAEGRLDTSFGTGGMVMHRVVEGYTVSDVRGTIQPDGRILATCLCTRESGHATTDGLLVVRCMADGRLDVSFGVGGFTLWEGEWRRAIKNAGVAVQPDGKIVAAGWGADDGNIVLRFLPSGGSDTGFGEGGVVREARGYTNFNDVGIRQDGHILVGGYNVGVAAIFCYRPDGSPDSGFAEDGMLRLPDNGPPTMHFNGIVIQSDAQVVAAGLIAVEAMANDGLVVRATQAGELDQDFNNGEPLHLPGRLDQCMDIAIDGEGRLTILGRVKSDSKAVAVCRLLADGSLDASFGDAGVFIFHIPPAIEPPATVLMQDLLIQSPGKALVISYSAPPIDARIGPLIARILI